LTQNKKSDVVIKQDCGRYLMEKQLKLAKITEGVLGKPRQLLARFRAIFDKHLDLIWQDFGR
jgi:superfamily II helicase